MPICSNCGAAVPPEREFCTICGESVIAQEQAQRYMGTYRQPRAEGGYATRDPAYVYTNPDNKPLNVLSTGGFVGSIILMGLPVIGFIICIVWACGGTSNPNRRNFARANLILMLIAVVLVAALSISLSAALGMSLFDLISAMMYT